MSKREALRTYHRAKLSAAAVAADEVAAGALRATAGLREELDGLSAEIDDLEVPSPFGLSDEAERSLAEARRAYEVARRELDRELRDWGSVWQLTYQSYLLALRRVERSGGSVA